MQSFEGDYFKFSEYEFSDFKFSNDGHDMDGSTRRVVRADWAPLRPPARESTAEKVYLCRYDYKLATSFSVLINLKSLSTSIAV